MITFLRHKEIDKERWDICIKASQYPIVYAESWYLDVVSPNWGAYVVLGEDKYTVVFPLTEKSKAGIKYLAQPPFCQQLGLFYTEEVDEHLFLGLIRKKYLLIDISLNSSNIFSPHNFDVVERRNYEMRLNSDYEKIAVNYNSNRKRDLKKALSQEVSIKETEDIDFFIKFFMQEKGLFIKGLKGNVAGLLRNMYTIGTKKSAVKLFFAYNFAHEICAVGLFLFSSNRIIFLLGTSNKEGQKNGSMTLLMDDVIHKNSNNDMVLDFEGSMIPGVAKFYESLGGKEKKYISLKASRLPVLLKFFKKMKAFMS